MGIPSVINQGVRNPPMGKLVHDYNSQTQSVVEVTEDRKEGPMCFTLQVKLDDGRVVSAPFWTESRSDSSLTKWCFQNGNPHSCENLKDMVEEMLPHLKNGEKISPKNTW